MSIFDDAIDLSEVNPSEWKNLIGDGYRYCCYTNDHDRNGRIVFLGYDREGNRRTFVAPHRSHIKFNVKYKTNEKDIYGRYVETRYFKNSYDRKKYLDSVGSSMNIVECLPPQSEFLHKVFDHAALDDHFNKQEMRIFYYDIENEIDGPANANAAATRINALTVYDTETKKYYTWSLNKVDNLDLDDEYDEEGNLVNECKLKSLPKDTFVIFDWFNGNETRMLEHFLDWYENNRPDVLAGYNSQSYDDVFLMRRIENVIGKRDAQRMSPVGKYRFRENNLDNERANKQAEVLVDIDGVFQADVLVLYRDKFKIHQPLDGGNSLDNVGETECGIHKIHYKNIHVKGHPVVYSLKELYEKDWNRFIKYNIMDVYCLKTVEEKVKTIPLARTITSAGLSNYDSIYSSIGYLIGSLIMFAKTQMGVTFTSYQNRKDPNFRFAGAFVFPVTPGLYRGGVACVDFNSLYPSVIQSVNLSPETYVGKISRYPIVDKNSEFFTLEAAIDLNDSDIIGDTFDTEDEKEFRRRYDKKLYGGKDSELDKFYLLPANEGPQKVITRKQLDELLMTKCILTRNNTLFLKHSVKNGVVSQWCKHFYALRKVTKKRMQKLELDVYNNRVPKEEIPATNENIQNLDSRQQAIKIMINSIFGICGCSHSPIANKYIAQTITKSGRYCNLSAAKFITKKFTERFGIPPDYVTQNGGDTDSAAFSTKIMIKR
jgi:DNA polymerase elongation subunit (family B)